MAETSPEPTVLATPPEALLQMLDLEADGYCDSDTGTCAMPS